MHQEMPLKIMADTPIDEQTPSTLATSAAALRDPHNHRENQRYVVNG